jgi:drug/metabolite transporter (DMT)-like permease
VKSAGRDHNIGVALVAVSAASFGSMAIFGKVVYSYGVDPVTLLFVRFVIAGAAMVVLMRVGGHAFPRGRLLGSLVALGGVGYVAQSLSFFTALTLASAALVALLLYLYPAIVTVAAAVLLGEPLTRVKVGAVALALLGSGLTIGRAGGGRPLGIALGVAAAVIYAVYILVSSRIAPRAGAIPAATVVMLAAAAVFGVVVAIRGVALPTAPAGWLALVALALVSTVVAIVTFFAGLERIGPTEASTVSTLEPMVTVALAAVVLNEAVTFGQIAGGAMIVTAVVILARAGRPKLVPSEVPPA